MRNKKASTLFPLELQYFAEGEETKQQPVVQTQKNEPDTKQDGKAQEPKPDNPEPTMEGLLAQMAELKAQNAKLKNDYDKLCTSEGTLRKQLRAKQTAEEQEAEAKAEEKAQHEEYVKGLEKRLSVIEATSKYLEMGMDKALAEETATADVEGNRDVVAANIQKYHAEWKKAAEASIRQEYLDKMPTPQSGNGVDVDYSKKFNDAMANGDKQAAALAILQSANANA